MQKRILLTGATGSVGLETLQELLHRRDRYLVRVLSLDTPAERRILQPFADRIEIIWGDLCNLVQVERAVVDVQTVLHVAAIIPPLADHLPQLAYQVNVGGTQNLITAMQAQNQPPRLIFTSSISVYGDRLKNPLIQVNDPLSPALGDEYARTKIQAEGLVQASGLRWTIFRLCGILTPRLKIQPLMFHMPLDTALEWCHHSDVGLALANAAENEAVDGQVFNLGGGEACRILARDFLAGVLPLFGVKPELLPEYAFATQNFHSGYYADGRRLNDILGFQRKNLSDYWREVQQRVSPLQKMLIRCIPHSMVRHYFLKMSEPLRAIRENDTERIARFYGSRAAFERLLPANLRQSYTIY